MNALIKPGFLVPFLALTMLGVGCSGCHPQEEQFLEPVNISNSPNRRSTDPAAAIDTKGTLHVVWTEDSSSVEDIYYAYKPRGGSWSAPANVSNSGHGRLATVAVGSDDRVHLAWQNYLYGGAPHWRILYSWKDGTSGWSVPETVSADLESVSPSIAVDGINNVHLCWEAGGYHSRIFYAQRSPGGSWTPPQQLTMFDYVNEPHLAAGRQGDVHLAFQRTTTDFNMSDIMYMTKPAGGVWSDTFNVSNTGRGRDWGSLGLVADQNGDVHLAWHDDSATWRRGGFYRMRDASGNWQGKSAIFDSAPISESFATYTNCLVLGSDGRLLIPIASNVPGQKYRVCRLYTSKSPGSKWSAPDTCGLMMLDPEGLPADVAVWDREAILYVFGYRAPDAQHSDYPDIFCIECETQRR